VSQLTWSTKNGTIIGMDERLRLRLRADFAAEKDDRHFETPGPPTQGTVAMKKNRHVGSSFDEFLREEGMLADAEAVAIKRIVALQLARMMKKQRITKAEMARRMKTSRSALDRLLDPRNASVTLQTLERAAQALGKRLRVEFAA
jgi:DNA-binding Xre family transcriptional regulator